MFDINLEFGLDTMYECIKLGQDHYYEVESGATELPYSINEKLVTTLLELDVLKMVVARSTTSGVVVGYFCFMVSDDLLTSELCSKELAIFVRKDYRNSGLFSGMLEYVESYLKRIGVRISMIGFRDSHNEKLPLNFGYEKSEIVYRKILV